MRDVTRVYEAYRLRCSECERAWRVVYLVTRWQDSSGADLTYYTRDGVTIGSPWHDERCGACGAAATVEIPRAELPQQVTSRETTTA